MTSQLPDPVLRVQGSGRHHHRKKKDLTPPHENLTITCRNPPLKLEMHMGDGPATPTAGVAGWEEVQRIERPAMTSFNGLPAFQQDVPIMLDGFAEGESVEPKLRKLLSLKHAVFVAEGPIFESGSRFVFGDEPEYGEMIRRTDGTLVRVRLTLKLMKFVRPDLAGHEPRKHHKGKSERERTGAPVKTGETPAPRLSFTTGAGDTLAKIAIKVFGEQARWKEIGKLNGISDPYRKLPAGKVLKLPPP